MAAQRRYWTGWGIVLLGGVLADATSVPAVFVVAGAGLLVLAGVPAARGSCSPLAPGPWLLSR